MDIIHGYRDSGKPESPDDVRKNMAAQGNTVVELAQRGGRWVVVKDSPYNRRITANTPVEITGPAAGAGFSLALSCDIRVGNKEAFFLSNYSKIGLTGDYGISWYLTNLLGPSKAKELMFCNHRIYADEAYKIGILNFLFTKSFESNLKNFLDNLLSQSHYALKLIKKNIDFAGNNNLRKSLRLEAKHLIMSSNSEEHKLAVAKFKKN